MKKLVTAILLSSILGTPALADDAAPKLTQQDLADIGAALSVVGSHCNGDAVAACQAGADSKAVYAKVKAIFDAQKLRDEKKP